MLLNHCFNQSAETHNVRLTWNKDLVMVIVVWETWLNDGAEAEGLRLTRQIWSDMQHFDGYVSHQLLVDEDAANHLPLVSQWQTREAVSIENKGSKI